MLNMQNVKDIEITEGNVRTIHDEDHKLIWGRLAYDTKYDGNTDQQTYSGKNLMPLEVSDNTTSRTSPFKISLPAGTYTISFDLSEIKLGTNESFTIQMTIAGAKSGGGSYDAIISGTISSTTATHKSFTFTTTADSDITTNSNIIIAQTYWDNGARAKLSNIQIEAGSTPTAYEPYVGGVPAPNPDYPQDVNVVTGEQTVKMTGKNLFDWAGLEQNSGDYANATLTEWNTNGVTITGNASTGVEFASSRGIFRPAASNTNSAFRVYLPDNATVTISADITLLENNYTPKTRIILDPGGVVGSSTTLTLNESIRVSQTFNNVAEGVYRPVFSLNSNKLKIENIQLEISSTASPFQPYQSQSYTISLGSTELCKIGDYQDYIYKSGGDWYVHKTVGKSMLGNLNWTTGGTNQSNIYRMQSNGLNGMFVHPTTNSVPLTGLCTHYLATRNDEQGTYGCNIGISGARTGDNIFIYTPDYNTSSSADSFKTWLANNNVTFYYALVAPTDTKITGSTLITQLDAIHQFLTRYGYNSSVTGNLPLIINQTSL